MKKNILHRKSLELKDVSVLNEIGLELERSVRPFVRSASHNGWPLGRIEKMVPTEILLSRLADPSSGSIATQNGAEGRRVSGNAASSERTAATGVAAQGAPYHLVGDDVDIALLIAVRIDAAVPAGSACERSIRDQHGKFDGRGGLDDVARARRS